MPYKRHWGFTVCIAFQPMICGLCSYALLANPALAQSAKAVSVDPNKPTIPAPKLHADTASIPVRLSLKSAAGGGTAVTLDLAALSRLQTKSITTIVPWLNSKTPAVWEGVPLARLVALARGEGHDIKISALDGYSAIVPWSDISRFDPILAWSFNGEDIKVRDKGPLVVIYPFSQYRELSEKAVFDDRSVWHANRIEIQ